MKVEVTITEVFSRTVSVEANSETAALETVKQSYDDHGYPLKQDNRIDVQFSTTKDSVPSVVTLDKGIDTRCLILIKDENVADTDEGRRIQVAQAAYIDGYIAAAGELSRFITRLWESDKKIASTTYHSLTPLRNQQSASYDTMVERLNNKVTWDEAAAEA